MVFEMTNSNKSVFIDRNTSHIKHGWQAKRMIMEYNAGVSCALIGHNFPTVVQGNRSVLYESAACYMETPAVLYENVFESMSRSVTVR